MKNQKSKNQNSIGATIVSPFFTQSMQIFSVLLQQIKTLKEVIRIMEPERGSVYYNTLNNVFKETNKHFLILTKMALDYTKDTAENF